MKVFNLTDVKTDALVKRGLYNQVLVVGNQGISPGGSADVSDEHRRLIQNQIEHLVMYGALAVNELPPSYKAAKLKQGGKSVPPPPSAGHDVPAVPATPETPKGT